MHYFLDLMEKLSYFLKLGKCEFEKSSVEFLGWLVTKEGVMVDPSKVVGLAEWPCKLHNLKELRQTLGILGYQRLFIRGYASMARGPIYMGRETYGGIKPINSKGHHSSGACLPRSGMTVLFGSGHVILCVGGSAFSKGRHRVEA